MSLIVFKEQSAHGNVGSGINHCFPSRETSDQCGSFVLFVFTADLFYFHLLFDCAFTQSLFRQNYLVELRRQTYLFRFKKK